MKNLHYPSDSKNAAEVAATLPEAVHRIDVIRYGQDHWDAARIDAEINQAADWAAADGVPLGDEFGAYRYGVNPQDRIAWIKDTRAALEHHNIGGDAALSAASVWSRRRAEKTCWIRTRFGRWACSNSDGHGG